MPVLSAEQVDVRMDHESLKQAGTLLGTGGIVVMDETACMVRAAIVIARFFRHETCGQCTQCREGTAWLYKLLRRIEGGQGTTADLGRSIKSAATWKARRSARFPMPRPGPQPDSSAVFARVRGPRQRWRMPAARELRAVMAASRPKRRRATLGDTGQVTIGSVNEPRESEEHGHRFNEKWIYRIYRRRRISPRNGSSTGIATTSWPHTW